MENECMYQLNDIDRFPVNKKGEAVILAHDDYLHIVCNTLGQRMNVLGQIFAPSFIYDISPNTLRDFWVVRAPGVDGNSGRYVVAASAGNTPESGFCS
ncbi:unnamed protein product [Brassica oleracea]